MLKSFAPALVLALIGGAAAAGAPEGSALVRLGDLRPADPQSQKVLEKRIERASLEVCGAAPGSFADVKRATAKSDCYKEALAQTQRQVQARAFAAR